MNPGFFDIEETTIIRGDEAPTKKGASSIVANCSTCGLSTQCVSPKMAPSGKGKKRILIVAEAPGKEEDKQGKQLVGESGQLLREILEEIGIDLDKDCWKTNALCCHPPKSADPEPLQIMACRKRLLETVEELKPQIIIPLGRWAMEGLVGHRLTGRIGNVSMTDWEGAIIPDQELKCWLLPTWHPAFLIRQKKDKVICKQIAFAFKAALKILSEEVPFPEYDYMERCHVITEPAEAIEILKDLRRVKNTPLAFDYETTGLKPHREGHEIVSASISNGEEAWAFLFSPNEEFEREWKRIMLSNRIEKTCHNSKFESNWTKGTLGYWPENITWCTMLAAKSLKNKRKVNLKFQTYIHFGISGYDSEVDDYLQTPNNEDKLYGANGFNMIKNAPVKKMLMYNAADSLFTSWLREEQERQMDDHILKGFKFFLDSVMHLARAEQNGIHLDVAAADLCRASITEVMNDLEVVIKNAPEMKKWDKQKPFRPSAPEDLSHLVFNLMKHKPETFTDTGKPQANKAAMDKIKVKVVEDVQAWKKWKKARDTYVADFVRESVGGFIHPVFNLHIVDTFRSSADSPNFQNIPKRDKEVATKLRMLLKPHPGHMLMEYDYKAVEVGISACYNKDPNLIRYITDPSTDMHRDMAEQIFLRDKVTKEERNVAKNGFVFPEFYGSYYEQVAPDMYEKCGEETRIHLKSQGIRTVKDFTAHVQEIEDDFWGNRFAVYADWKKKIYKDYEKKGYVDLYTGFRCYGPMNNREVSNYPVQGSAFHCLLWTFSRVSEEIEKQGLRSRMMGQIHDAAVPSVHPEEEAEMDRLMKVYGTQKIREYWPWIIVPLSIEKSRSEVDGSWAKMEDCGLI